MDKEKIRRLVAIMYANARAEDAEEYARLRDECYSAAAVAGDSMERTLFEDMCTVFGNPAIDELNERLSGTQQETETALSSADVRELLSQL